MKAITIEQWKEVLMHIADTLAVHEAELNDLDSLIGDGDHGSSIHRGFEAVQVMINQRIFSSVGELFTQVGKVLLFDIGGAIGPLLGSFFTAAGKQAGEITETDLPTWAEMFTAGVTHVQSIGKAQLGDKTILDALLPASDTFQKASTMGKPMILAFQEAAASARQGADQTEGMVAKFGRAKFLGSRAIGHQDPGANSMALMLAAMFEAFRRYEDVDSE